MRTMSIPAPCPTCRGSRRIVELRSDREELPPYLRDREGCGFFRPRCPTCHGTGEAQPPEPAAEIPVLEQGWEEPPDATEIAGELISGAAQSAAALHWRARHS